MRTPEQFYLDLARDTLKDERVRETVDAVVPPIASTAANLATTMATGNPALGMTAEAATSVICRTAPGLAKEVGTAVAIKGAANVAAVGVIVGLIVVSPVLAMEKAIEIVGDLFD